MPFDFVDFDNITFEWKPNGEIITSDHTIGSGDLTVDTTLLGTYIDHAFVVKKKADDLKIARIIQSDPVTVVFFADGEKVVVRKPSDKEYDIYEAVSAAIAIHLYGNNTKFKKAIEKHMDEYLKAEAAKKKEDQKKQNTKKAKKHKR